MYDKISTQQGLFTFKYRWLVVTDIIFLQRLEKRLGNITHLAILSHKEACKNDSLFKVDIPANHRSFMQICRILHDRNREIISFPSSQSAKG